jgi:hypothetical protein
VNEEPRSSRGGTHVFRINPDIRIKGEESVIDATHTTPPGVIGQRSTDALVESLLPVIFIMSYKNTDLLIEWILAEHHANGFISDFSDREGYDDKESHMRKLIGDGDLVLPSPLDKLNGTFERLFAFYYIFIEPRHAVVHRDDFTVEDGVFKADMRRDGSYRHELTTSDILELARISSLIGSAIEHDNVTPTQKQELLARLDQLSSIHREGSYDTTPPWAPKVEYRLEAGAPDSAPWAIDLNEARDRVAGIDWTDKFMLIVKVIYDRRVLAEWTIPDDKLNSRNEITVSADEDDWEAYRTQ